ncbi:MAG: hypothetical protein ACYC6T_06805 [Thermoleophilia bacterium]
MDEIINDSRPGNEPGNPSGSAQGADPAFEPAAVDGIGARIEESKNWFERAAEHIPGYKGYKNKELRREADKLQREYVAERLEAARLKLEDVALAVTDRGDLQLLAGVDRTGRKLRTIKDRYLYADYGYAGIFDTVKVGEDIIEQLYRFDVQSQEYALHLEQLATTLSADSPSLRSDLEIFDQRVVALDQSFAEREHLITGAGR